MTLERDPEWEPTQLECSYGKLFLRVQVANIKRARSWRWFVIELEKVTKSPYWFAPKLGKGSSQAIAAGYSSTREKACRDAVLMADAILKDPKSKIYLSK